MEKIELKTLDEQSIKKNHELTEQGLFSLKDTHRVPIF